MNSVHMGVIVARVTVRYVECEQVTRISPVIGSGGFSGARLWRVDSQCGSFCLRRWPAEHPSRDRLAYIHRVLSHAAHCGLKQLAVPIADRVGCTIVEDDGAFWELNRWLPGKADYRQAPSEARLADAMRVLAEFHRATDALDSPVTAGPPGITARAEQLRQLLHGGCTSVRQAVRSGDWPRLASQAEDVLACFPAVAPQVLSSLERASRFSVRLQACIRDIWHDHVLFDGDRVSGVIDFGAMRPDHVAGDIARLLGSLVGDDRGGWSSGLAAYEALRPLSRTERELVTVNDRSGVLLSGMNWLQWIYVEGRRFDDHPRINQRLDEILGRLHILQAILP